MPKKTFKIFSFYFLLLTFHISHLTFHVFAQQPTQEWVRRFSDTSSVSWQSTSIKFDSLGFIYVLARTLNEFGFIKYDSNGNLLVHASHWPGGYPTGGGTHFDVTPAGDVYVTGSVDMGFFNWIYTTKFNSSGVFQWGKLYNIDNDDIVKDVKVDKTGNVVVIGGSLVGSSNYALIIKYNQGGTLCGLSILITVRMKLYLIN